MLALLTPSSNAATICLTRSGLIAGGLRSWRLPGART